MTQAIRCAVFVSVVCLLSAGCRSHVIAVTVENRSDAAIRNLEVTYPGGSFGKAHLNAGEDYTYRIKTLRDGNLTVSFEDAGGKSHPKQGPKLKADQEGALQVQITAKDVTFTQP
jgi:hypothetical protein